MATLPEALAPRFWAESGITQRDLDLGLVSDLGARLCKFLSVMEGEKVLQPVDIPSTVNSDSPEFQLAS